MLPRTEAWHHIPTPLKPCHRPKMRYLVVINLANYRSASETVEVLGVSRSNVYEVARRFREQGELGSQAPG